MKKCKLCGYRLNAKTDAFSVIGNTLVHTDCKRRMEALQKGVTKN